ncbi:MAG: bifunctional UDP-N-acetylglucosamine diphosphorylase/glucosamine-1-phosphate N-acetyltransferase GlmU [Candidatus Obscuribacterales bacterium]|nr:bifunctional UDP-N-acetylglucosamine diphosphorylase/glucosamine-1-phosphate N-acetyltransferase GlmU [Candidatus Obscuribacterales bacterium]
MAKTYKNRVRAVLLAAGQGKRMKSELPKVLHPILGKAILGRLLDSIDCLELEHVHIVIGHGSQQVVDYLNKNQPKTPWSTHLQEPQLGTGHALMQVVPELQGFNGTLLVTVSDCPLLKASTLSQLIETHQKESAAFSLLTTIVEDPKSYGRIIRNLKDKRLPVTAIVEHKDASPAQRAICEINPAIYCLEWPQLEAGLNSLKNNNQQEEYYLTDLLAWSAEQKLKIADTLSDWKEVSGINSRLDLAECEQYLKEQTLRHLALDSGVSIVDMQNTWIAPEVRIGQESRILPGCYITGDVEIGKACVIGPNTQISGPAKIGDRSIVSQSQVTNSEIASDCRVGPFAHLRDRAVISSQCRIGNFVEIKKSKIGKESNVSHLSYIGDATLGSEVNIGAGTITANYDRLSGKKSITAIGDKSSTGSNSVLVAPVILGDNAMVAAGSVITKDVPDGALAVARGKQCNIEGWVDKRRNSHDTMKLPKAAEQKI